MNQERLALPPSVLSPYTGGHTVVRGGYVFELCPDHPKANPFGFVPQHRLVVERHLGYYLSSKMHVHHRDEVKTNNHISNLQVLSHSDHMKHHRREIRERKTGPLVRENVRQALQEGGLKKAAAQLGVHTETIRNLFPDLVAPYKRRSPTRIDDPDVIDKILAVALDDKIGYREVARQTGVSYQTVRRICERNGIEWSPKGVPTRPGRPPGTSKILKDQELVLRLRELAPDPQCSLHKAAEILGVSAPSVSKLLSHHKIAWVQKNKAGYKHKNPRAPFVRTNPDLVERVRVMAADKNCGTMDAVRQLGVCARTLRIICKENGFQWLSPPVGGRRPRKPAHMTSTHHSSGQSASQSASGGRLDSPDHPELPL